MYAMLLTPKVAGAAIIAGTPAATRVFGGHRAFLTAFLVEVALSIAYAPILMIQQTKAVLRAIFTRSEPWAPQSRAAQAYPLGTLLRFHAVETLVGVLLLSGLLSGLVSLWLIPIVFSLVMAVPLSALSALNLMRRAPEGLRLDSPHTLREPGIVKRAKAQRAGYKGLLNPRQDVPAE